MSFGTHHKFSLFLSYNKLYSVIQQVLTLAKTEKGRLKSEKRLGSNFENRFLLFDDISFIRKYFLRLKLKWLFQLNFYEQSNSGLISAIKLIKFDLLKD